MGSLFLSYEFLFIVDAELAEREANNHPLIQSHLNAQRYILLRRASA